ncbi:MAG TPA: SpaA isopeptide-forming pilin-related protein [Pyrinomonadaceae bacterium]
MQQKMWRCVVGVSLLFLIVCASVARSDSKAGNTGITGVVLVTPIRPGPIRAGSETPTAAPLPNATFTVTSDSGAVTRFTTDTMGRFKILLEPGHYVVVLAENRFPKPCGPFEINVEPGKMTDVEWRCDSGMR